MGGHMIDEIGHRYGKVVVIARLYDEIGKRGSAKWIYKCDCGNEGVIRGTALRSGNMKSCGCASPCYKKNEVGKRYGRVVVLGPAPSKGNYGARWLYQCDCGNVRIALGHILRRPKGIMSCGCRHGKPKDYAAFCQLFNHYKQGARRRKYVFDIPEDTFRELTKGNCSYCGVPPTSRFHPAKGSVRSGNVDYIYNGLDRVDSSKGYTIDNVVTACKICNRAKSDMKHSEFLVWIDRLVATCINQRQDKE